MAESDTPVTPTEWVTERLAGDAPAKSDALPERVGRYRIEAELGRGGMGVVYRAVDNSLGRKVALKVLNAGLADSLLARARFVREAQAASRLDHRNIATIHEVGEEDGRPFIAMALHPGVTLRQRLHDGRPSLEEILDTLDQLAAALEAAHAAGIVHRDLKPENVLLPEGAPLKLVDFGIAKLIEGEGGMSGLTEAGELLGTVAYMAPEQVRAEAVDGRADLWALGILAHEMLTGSPPFSATSKVQAIGQILADPPRRLTRSEAPRWLADLIGRLLMKDRDARPRNASEVRALLARRGRGRLRGRLLAGGLLLLALGGAAAAGLRRHATPVRLSLPAPAGGRRSIALLPARGEPWLATAVDGLLRRGLAVGEDVRVLPFDSIPAARDKVTADLVVDASVAARGGGVRLTLTVAGATLDVEERDARQLAAAATRELRAALGLPALVATQEDVLRATPPASDAAARLYAEGILRLRAYDAQGARARLDEAVAADERFAPAHAALSDALALLGQRDLAQREAQKAFEYAGNLPREERLGFEGRQYERSGDWDRAAEVYRTLRSFFPDHLEHGLRLAAAQIGGYRNADALATLDELRRLPGAAGDPRIDLAEAQAAFIRPDYPRARAAAERAAGEAHLLGLTALEADATFLAARGALRGDGKARGTELLAAAGALYGRLGDRRNVARVVLEYGYPAEHPKDQVRFYSQALAIAREAGDQRTASLALLRRGVVSMRGASFLSGRRDLEEALAVAQQAGDRGAAIDPLIFLGFINTFSGNVAAAREQQETALAHARAIGDRWQEQSAEVRLARTLMLAGDLEGALRNAEAGLRITRDLQSDSAASQQLYDLGLVRLMQGDLPAARAALEESVRLGGVGNRIDAADEQVALAEVEIAEGKGGAAVERARASIPIYVAEGVAEFRGRALSVVARALLQQGKLEEAKAMIGEAETILLSFPTYYEVKIVAAHLRGDRAALEDALEHTTRAGCVPVAMLARLYLGTEDLRAGRGRARLQALEKDARAAGYGLFAVWAAERR